MTTRRRTLLYRVVPHNGGLVFAEERTARHVAAIHRALSKARTWAEFRSMVPRDEYSSVIQSSFDDIGEPRPKGADYFSPDHVAGFSDGDYPRWLQAEMEAVLPEELLRRFGTRAHTVLNGSFWMIPPENAKPLVQALTEMGFTVRSARRLQFY